MKKTSIRLALFLVALVMVLSSCTTQKKQGDLNAVYQALEETGVLPDMLALSEEEALDFLGLETAGIQDSVLMISEDSLLADEVLLLRMKDKAAADTAKTLLDQRMKQKGDEARTYSPEQYAIIQRGRVLRQGLSLALLVSPQVDQLVKAYEGFEHK
ncbi:MAG: DUF4358 domain-containing protein [Clostridiales bacterium]|jgi:hypothetical protein|nr:DUF4358 domain-containing protein [Clostridiales bacterium]